jgi:sarcosine oxidase/L-pipecolate oxidase
MATSRTTTKVIVVGGGGTMGSSTALHLLRFGYTPSHITVLDTYPLPSAQSAGNDLNKIMGISARNKIDTKLELEALDMWLNDGLFKPYFHQTGRVISSYFFCKLGSDSVQLDCASTEKGVDSLRKQYRGLIDADSGLVESCQWLNSSEEILAKAPVLDMAMIQGWKAIYNSSGGWLAAAKAITAIGEALKAEGIRFGFGE